MEELAQETVLPPISGAAARKPALGNNRVVPKRQIGNKKKKLAQRDNTKI